MNNVGFTMSNLVPMVVEREGNRERAMDIYSLLHRDRIIFVTEEVNRATMGVIKAQLLQLQAEDPERDITMYIDCPGGEIMSGLGVYNMMQLIKPDVRTVNMGMAASMGSFLMMAGAPGKRYCLPDCWTMIHQPSGGAQGKESDIERQAEHIKRLKIQLYKRYHEHTGLSIEKLTELMDRDTWLDAEEALKLNLIDKIVYTQEDMA